MFFYLHAPLYIFNMYLGKPLAYNVVALVVAHTFDNMNLNFYFQILDLLIATDFIFVFKLT